MVQVNAVETLRLHFLVGLSTSLCKCNFFLHCHGVSGLLTQMIIFEQPHHFVLSTWVSLQYTLHLVFQVGLGGTKMTNVLYVKYYARHILLLELLFYLLILLEHWVFCVRYFHLRDLCFKEAWVYRFIFSIGIKDIGICTYIFQEVFVSVVTLF